MHAIDTSRFNSDSMRNAFTISILIVGLLAGSVRPASAQDLTLELEESVISAGGGTAEVGNRTLTATVGQASPAGRGASGAYTLFSGHPSPFFAIQAVNIRFTQELSDAQPTGTDVTLTAIVQSRIASVDEVQLFYRAGGASSFTSVPMASADGAFEASIPGEAITPEGIAYFITATDAEGNTAREPVRGVRSFEIRVDNPGLVKDSPQPSGDTQSAYRLISVPADLDSQSPGAVLEDDLGNYDDTVWRFFEPIGPTISEFPRTNDMRPGKAFWLIVRDGADNLNTGAGEVLSLDEPFEIVLQDGWNFIGNPFNFPIPVENVRTEDGQDIVLRSYAADGYNTPQNPVTTMDPFSGYAVRSNGETTLFIDPVLPESNSDANSTSKQRSLATQSFQPAWMIHIRAASGQTFDANNIAAVASQASAGWDPLDWLEPPAIASNVSVSFPHPEWESSGTHFSSDVRGIPVQGETWTFETKASNENRVALTFEGLAQVPSSFEVWLLDDYTKASQNLRATPRYTIESPVPDQARSFRLIVGESDYVERALESAGARPASYELADIYPNPTPGGATIRYGLPKEQPVTLTVYNVLGQKVATLMDNRTMEPGFHTIQWRGETGSGAPLASGVYFVRMRAGDFTASKKIVRVN